LKSDGLLLTVLTETDGSLSVNHGYKCFVRETNQQKVFMCVLFIIFLFFLCVETLTSTLTKWKLPVQFVPHDCKEQVSKKRYF
jgi:hypothetical protein